MRVFFFIILLAGCGSENSSYNPTPPSQKPPIDLPDDFVLVKAVIDEQCAVSGCHAGAAFVQNGPAFKASSAGVRVGNDSMPKKTGPNYDKYNAEKKKILTDFLK